MAVFLTFWLGAIVVINLLSLVKAAPDSIPIVGAFTLFMLAAGFSFVAFGRLLARDEGPALLDFIRQTTGAHDVPAELRPFC